MMMKRIAAISASLIMAVLILMSGGMQDAFAEPVVLRDVSKGIGVEDSETAPERDRSLQDGTLVYSMTPVYPEDVQEGDYEPDVISDSRFFKIIHSDLSNKDGRMTAAITVSSTSYAYIYQGTAEQAAAADSSEWIAADENDGYGSFDFSVEALNKELPCAAFSKKKQKWYDRNIVFLADSMPDGAVMIELNEEGGTIADTQDAALQVIYIALAIIAAGGILNHFVKKRYYE
jgi:hypothetical protein